MDITSYKFDAIVVGAGPAGSSAAYTLSKKGFKVLLVERGRAPGSKNMFGGRVYIAPIKQVYPDFEKTAPIHRWVAKEKISFIKGEDMTSIEYEGKEKKSFTTYLTQLAAWMAKQAENAGATFLNEITVNNLYMEDGKVRGIKVGDEVLKSEVVIDAEGVNRLLLEKVGISPKLSPKHVALGVKEVIKLGVEDINKLFGLDGNEGLAWILMGDITAGCPGGAFIYTNRDSVSLGLVILLEEAIYNVEEHISRYIEKLRLHPLLYKYFKDGRIMEYSAHLIPEDVWGLMPQKLYYDGLLIAGDAAGFLLNVGYTYRGVDFATYSGYLAAKAVEDAFNKGGATEAHLSIYKSFIENSFIFKQLRKFRQSHELMKNKRVFEVYPELATLMSREIFSFDWETPSIKDAFDKARKGRVGLFTLLRDLYGVSKKI